MTGGIKIKSGWVRLSSKANLDSWRLERIFGWE